MLKVRLFYIIYKENTFPGEQWPCFCRHMMSEGTDTNHRHHHNVAKGGQHGDPQPDGVAGHLPIILCFRGPGVAGVEVGGGRLQRRVAVVRRIHEGSTDGREVLQETERRRESEGGPL